MVLYSIGTQVASHPSFLGRTRVGVPDIRNIEHEILIQNPDADLLNPQPLAVDQGRTALLFQEVFMATPPGTLDFPLECRLALAEADSPGDWARAVSPARGCARQRGMAFRTGAACELPGRTRGAHGPGRGARRTWRLAYSGLVRGPRQKSVPEPRIHDAHSPWR